MFQVTGCKVLNIKREEQEPETRMPRMQPPLGARTNIRTCHYPSPGTQHMMSEAEMEKQVRTEADKGGLSEQHRVLMVNVEIISQSLPELTQGTAAQKE